MCVAGCRIGSSRSYSPKLRDQGLPQTSTRPTLIEFDVQGETDALRTANLRMRSGQVARPQQALRHDHIEDLGTTRHQAGRLLDHGDRRVQSDPLLHVAVGFSGGSREEVERVSGGPGMAYRAREDGGGGAHRRQCQELHSWSDTLFIGEIIPRESIDRAVPSKNTISRPVFWM